DGTGHEARRGGGRRAGRLRRQLPAVRERPGSREARRDPGRPGQPAGPGADRRLGAVRAQPARFPQTHHRSRRRAGHQARRRDRRGVPGVRRRQRHPEGLAMEAIDPTLVNLIIFVLAIYVGYHVVWNVTPALHTPLMAVTNAISAIIIVGAMLAAALTEGGLARGMGVVAVALAAVNVFGGFLVTRRMLEMFKKKDKKPAKESSQ